MQRGSVGADARLAAYPLDHVPRENTWLALTAGYVDTLGFVALFGLLTAHMTGNFILIGSELSGAGHGLLIKWLAFPSRKSCSLACSTTGCFIADMACAHARCMCCWRATWPWAR